MLSKLLLILAVFTALNFVLEVTGVLTRVSTYSDIIWFLVTLLLVALRSRLKGKR